MPRRPANYYDWGAVDWSRPTGEIARGLGCDITQVSRQRRKLAPQTIRTLRSAEKQPRRRRRGRARPAWVRGIDWLKSTEQIAAETGRHITTIYYHRRKEAPGTLARWTKRNAVAPEPMAGDAVYSQVVAWMKSTLRGYVRSMTPAARGRLWRIIGANETHFYRWLRGDDKALSEKYIDAIMRQRGLGFAPPTLGIARKR